MFVEMAKEAPEIFVVSGGLSVKNMPVASRAVIILPPERVVGADVQSMAAPTDD